MAGTHLIAPAANEKRMPDRTSSLYYRWTCKPNSVLQTGGLATLRSFYHLSVAAYPPTTDGQPLDVGIHGLASCSGVLHVRCRTHP